MAVPLLKVGVEGPTPTRPQRYHNSCRSAGDCGLRPAERRQNRPGHAAGPAGGALDRAEHGGSGTEQLVAVIVDNAIVELDTRPAQRNHIGLDAQWIDNSQLQSLIPLLPQRLAIGFMFLYAASEPKDLLQNMSKNRIDDRVLASLLAASFINFYRQIEQYRQSEKSPPTT